MAKRDPEIQRTIENLRFLEEAARDSGDGHSSDCLQKAISALSRMPGVSVDKYRVRVRAEWDVFLTDPGEVDEAEIWGEALALIRTSAARLLSQYYIYEDDRVEQAGPEVTAWLVEDEDGD